jgi:ubiquinone/menaquinone biosynthesis C-methylase UbiE
MLRARCRQARAIDVDPQLAVLEVAQGRIEDQPDKAVDWVVAVDVIEHNEDDEAFLRHMWRVARKGVYLTTPNRAHHPDRNWPYHVREYTPEEFAALFARVLPGGRCFQFGADTYCGNMRMSHLTSSWEHQGILCFKGNGGVFTAGLLTVREWMMTLAGRG